MEKSLTVWLDSKRPEHFKQGAPLDKFKENKNHPQTMQFPENGPFSSLSLKTEPILATGPLKSHRKHTYVIRKHRNPFKWPKLDSRMHQWGSVDRTDNLLCDLTCLYSLQAWNPKVTQIYINRKLLIVFDYSQKVFLYIIYIDTDNTNIQGNTNA